MESWHPKSGIDLGEIITHLFSHQKLLVLPCLSLECSPELGQSVPHCLRELGTELHESEKEQKRLYLSIKVWRNRKRQAEKGVYVARRVGD